MNDSQTAVLELIRRYDGACPRDFANHDIYRYSARIFELREMGYRIVSHRCRRHHHQKPIVEYRLLAAPKAGRVAEFDPITGGWK